MERQVKVSDTVHNEGIKMLAQMFHNIGIACVTAGLLVPIFAANLAVDHPNLNYITTAPIGILLGACAAAFGQLFLRTMMRDPK